MKLPRHFPILLFSALCALRWIGGSPWWSLTYDAVFYATTAEQAAHGSWLSAIGALWMPLTAWLATPGIWLGLSPTTSILALNWLVIVWILGHIEIYLTPTFQSHTARWVALMIASSPLIVSQATTVGSDTLFLGIATRIFLRTREEQPSFYDALLLPLLFLCRVPGLAVAALVLIFWFYLGIQRRLRLTRVFIFFLPSILSLVLLCAFFHKRTGHFVPSASFLLNSFFLKLEWLGGNALAWCQLYDSAHTVLGDLNALAAPIPSSPNIAFDLLWNYRAQTLLNYILGFLKAVPLPVLLVSLWGLSKTSLTREARWEILWCLVITIGMAFTTYVPRYFLGIIPIYGIWLGRGLSSIANQFSSISWLLVVTNLLFCGFQMPWREILKFQTHRSAGHELFKKTGGGHRIATTTNLVSAVQSRGIWRVLPCEDPDRIARYLAQQRIEYLILPNPSPPNAILELERQGIIIGEFEFGNEKVWRIN